MKVLLAGILGLILVFCGSFLRAADLSGLRALDLSLLEAMTKKDVARVREVLDAGANPNISVDEGKTPLMMAVGNDYVEIARILIEKGADVNARETHDGYCVIHIAVTAKKNSEDFVRLLLDKGADTDVVYAKGHTPLMDAVYLKKANLVKILLEAGANPDISDNDFGYTSLIVAVSNNDKETVRLLLDSGADLEIKSKNGDTALEIAVVKRYSEIAKMIQAQRQDIEKNPNFRDQTPFGKKLKVKIEEAEQKKKDLLAEFYSVIEGGLKKGGYEPVINSIHKTPNFEKDAKLMGYLGKAYLGSGQIDQAIETLTVAVRLDPKSGDANLNLSLAKEMKRKKDAKAAKEAKAAAAKAKKEAKAAEIEAKREARREASAPRQQAQQSSRELTPAEKWCGIVGMWKKARTAGDSQGMKMATNIMQDFINETDAQQMSALMRQCPP